jgi:hypothetical protein
MKKQSGIQNKAVFGKSVVKEMSRKVSKKEVDDVLREMAEEIVRGRSVRELAKAIVRGRRAVACIPIVEKQAVVVMPTEEYEAYTEAVTVAQFLKWAWAKDAKTESILGMSVVIDDKADKIRVCPNDLPKRGEHA